MQLTTLPSKLVNNLENKLAEFDRIGEAAFAKQMESWGDDRRQTLYQYMKLKNLKKRLDYMMKVERIRVHNEKDITVLQEQITKLQAEVAEMDF